MQSTTHLTLHDILDNSKLMQYVHAREKKHTLQINIIISFIITIHLWHDITT